MRKILLGMFIFFYFLLFISRVSYAQIPTLNLTAIQLPGFNCGDMNAAAPANKCCYYEPISNRIISKPNIPILDQIVDILNNAWYSGVVPVFLPLEQVTQQTVQTCSLGSPSTPGDLGNKNCICISPTPEPLTALSKLCNGSESGECNGCIVGGGIWTGLGCIYPNIKDFIEKTVLRFGIGLGGIISLICILYSAFILQTSRGNPEKIKRAQELLTSCITGLMLIIFSFFILKLIGIDILKIPGFSK